MNISRSKSVVGIWLLFQNSLYKAWLWTLVVANLFIGSKSRNKVLANKSWFTVCYKECLVLINMDKAWQQTIRFKFLDHKHVHTCMECMKLINYRKMKQQKQILKRQLYRNAWKRKQIHKKNPVQTSLGKDWILL